MNKLHDLIERLTEIEKNYGNLPVNLYGPPIRIRVENDHIQVIANEED